MTPKDPTKREYKITGKKPQPESTGDNGMIYPDDEIERQIQEINYRTLPLKDPNPMPETKDPKRIIKTLKLIKTDKRWPEAKDPMTQQGSMDKLIYIEWEDAVHNAEWFTSDLAEMWHDQTEHLVKECGWLVKEDKRGITLAGRLKPADNNTDMQYGGLQWIPKTWIHVKKEIKL